MDARSLALLASLSALPLAVSAAIVPADIQEPVLVTRVDCTIVIDTSGHVAEYRPQTELPSLIAERVRAMVQAVRFEPVEQDGHIVNAQVKARVTVTATKLDDGGMRLALDNLSFPDADAAERDPRRNVAVNKAVPIYPREALRYAADADVLAAVRFDRNGEATDVEIEQAALLHMKARPRDAATLLDMFAHASITALRQWKVDPATMVDPLPDGGFVAFIPVTWRIDRPGNDTGASKPGTWTLETRTVRRVPAWVPVADKAPQPGVADLADGEIGGVNRTFRLATPLPVAGS